MTVYLTIPSLLAALLAVPALAHADITAQFIESAPKDSFIFENSGNCAAGPLTLKLDLTRSSGALIFDTDARGAGVQVYQPLELIAGQALLAAPAHASDGSKIITLQLSKFPISARLGFTIDVDDTLGAREITVSGSEIKDAEVNVTHDGHSQMTRFDTSGTATISLSKCLP